MAKVAISAIKLLQIAKAAEQLVAEAIVQGRQGNVLKSVLRVQNCCFSY